MLRRVPEPFCVYLHPWEFDSDQPRLTAPWLQSMRHRVGLNTTARKLQQLLAEFEFGTMTEVISTGIAPGQAA
jgi:hypothetical protein